MTELTDERLLSMAAKALGYASIDPDRGAEEGPGSFRQALEVFPEELIAFARATLAAEPPAPAPAADGEREELARWLYCLADQRSCNRRRGIHPHPSTLTRAAALLRQPAPAPVAVSERPWEREGWCDAEGECWWRGRRDPAWWTAADPRMVHDGWLLPHWAIPRPPQGGEVAE